MSFSDLQRALRLAESYSDPIQRYLDQEARLRHTIEQANQLDRAFNELDARSALIRAAQEQAAYYHRHEEALLSARALTDYAASIETFQLSRQAALAEEVLLLQNQSAMTTIAKLTADLIKPIESQLIQQAAWEYKLTEQMMAVQAAWVVPECPELSFEGFARISRIADIGRNRSGYTDEAREVVDEDLGRPVEIEPNDTPDEQDTRLIDSGFNPSMLAFEDGTSNQVFLQVGFKLRSKFGTLPKVQSGPDPQLDFNPTNMGIITAVENQLRQLMSRKFGTNWLKKRIPQDVVDKWSGRQAEAIDKGEAKLDLIFYSDLMELKDIIIAGPNWTPCFASTFKNKDHFSTSMGRIHPIRRPLAHSRPIGTAQTIHLYSEAQFLMTMMGVSLFE